MQTLNVHTYRLISHSRLKDFKSYLIWQTRKIKILSRSMPPLTKHWGTPGKGQRYQHREGKSWWCKVIRRQQLGLSLGLPSVSRYQSGYLLPMQACLSYRVLGLSHTVFTISILSARGTDWQGKTWGMVTSSYRLNFVLNLKVNSTYSGNQGRIIKNSRLAWET